MMRRKFFALFILMSALCLQSWADANTLVIAKDTAQVGARKVKLDIGMLNSDDITSLQFDIYLPDGIEVDTAVTGKVPFMIGERTNIMSHIIICKRYDMQHIKVMMYSSKNICFVGSEGNVMSMYLNVKDDCEPGEYEISMKKQMLCTPFARTYNAADITEKILIVPAEEEKKAEQN